MSKKFLLAIALLTFSWSAGAVVIPLGLPIAEMNLNGTGSLPLAHEPGSGTEDYGFVDSLVTISALPGSELAGTITIDDNFLDPEFPVELLDPVLIQLDFTLFLSLTFEDLAPGSGNDYTGSLADSFTLTPVAPLTISTSGMVDFAAADLSDPLGSIPVTTSITSTGIKENLGEDVNQNGEEDFIEITAADFGFDENELLFEFVDELNPFAGVIITSATLELSGLVADVSTDPPFSLTVSTDPITPPPSPVDEPPVWLLLLPALALLRRLGSDRAC